MKICDRGELDKIHIYIASEMAELVQKDNWKYRQNVTWLNWLTTYIHNTDKAKQIVTQSMWQESTGSKINVREYRRVNQKWIIQETRLNIHIYIYSIWQRWTGRKTRLNWIKKTDCLIMCILLHVLIILLEIFQES